MVSFREYLSDFFFFLVGILAGNAVTVAVIAVLGGDIPGFLRLTEFIPAVGPPLLYTVVMHLLALLILTVMPAVGLFAIFYIDYLLIR